MKNIKQLKGTLEVDKLDADRKAGLYTDFKKVGGQVIDHDGPEDDTGSKMKQIREAAEKRNAEEEARKQKLEKQRQLDEARDKRNQDYLKALEEEDHSADRQDTKPELITTTVSNSKPNPYVDYLSAKIAAWTGGVMRLFGDRLSDSFLRLNMDELKSTLYHTTKILTSVLHQDEEVSRAIRARLKTNERFHFYFELLFRIESIAKEEFFHTVEQLFTRQIKTADAGPMFIRLYRNLATFAKYKPMINDAVQVVLQFEREIRSMDKGTTDSNIRYLKNNIHFVLGPYLNKLSLLVDYFFRLKYWKTNETLRKAMNFQSFLHYDDKDKIGYYTAVWEKEDQEAERHRRMEEERLKAQDNEQKRTEYLAHAEKGIILINTHIRFHEYLEKFKRAKDPRGVFEAHEKMFMIYTLFEFFDKEFSILLRSPKMEYEKLKDAYGHEVDVKFLMQNYYTRLEHIYELVKGYLRMAVSLHNLTVYQNMRDATADPEVRSLLEQQEKITREAIGAGRKVMEEYLNLLGLFVPDLGKLTATVKNPARTIDLEAKTIDKKILNGKRLSDAFTMLFDYCSALFFLLMEGDLCDQTKFLKEPKYLLECLKKPE